MNSLKSHQFKNFSNSSKVYLGLIFVLTVIGFLIRIKGLGKWPFALDEYYIIRSVQNILESGLPSFKFGGYYSRGLMYQYLLAAFLGFDFNPEFISRFISVVLNLAAIPGLYLLITKILGKKYVFPLLLLFVFSLWEIELSRFVRMYTFFQTIFIWYLYFYYKYLFEGSQKSIYWLWVISGLSIFVYEASIFIILMNFILIFWDQTKLEFTFKLSLFREHPFQVIIPSIIFIAAYLFLSFDFRTLYSNDLLPLQLNDYFQNLPKTSRIRVPIVLLFITPFTFYWYLFVSLIVLGLVIFRSIVTKFSLNNHTKYSIIFLVFLCCLNLYGLLIISASILFSIGWLNWNKENLRLYTYLLVIFIFFLSLQSIYAVLSSEWQNLTSYSVGPSIAGQLKILWKEFVNFPNFYELFALFRDTYKFHTFITLLILSIGFITLIIRNKNVEKSNSIFFGILIFLLLLVTTLNTQWFETRYFFFLYPLFLICLVASIKSISEYLFSKTVFKNILIYSLLAVILIFSEDYKIDHMLNIDTPEYNFRKSFSVEQRDHFYPRWDSRTVSELVNKNADDEDIIITDIQNSAYYLDRLDYLYRKYTSKDFRLESVNQGKNERWTSANLIFRYEDLLKVLGSDSGSKWLIINKTYGVHEFEDHGFFESINKHIYYESIDGTTYLYKIPKNFKII